MDEKSGFTSAVEDETEHLVRENAVIKAGVKTMICAEQGHSRGRS